MPQQVIQVDSFTAEPFLGNPAAVCVMAGPADEIWMQRVAAEMNLSETAFLHPEDAGYRLRWFTPAMEVSLCGHATLASAHVLWEEGHLQPREAATFQTASGILTAQRDRAWIRLDFPAKVPQATAAPAGLEAALGADPVSVAKTDRDFLVEVSSEVVLRNLSPDFRALAALPLQGLIVTSPAAAPDFDFYSRYFAPGAGIDEDPVTGSAHCALGPYWAAKLGKLEMTGYQASRRGGIVRVEVRGDRVHLLGKAVTVLRGQLLV
ncbi:MAG: PhzF family phenazine biosynthesis protein [Candidatus Sericytochromatia bacterium]|nr:PhzF family phenazine biosynthesis protein [Candidatus Tanganyikabacteria bacterium]